ncbi:MAG: DUF1579 domain-containing protein [Caldimonas sp.]
MHPRILPAAAVNAALFSVLIVATAPVVAQRPDPAAMIAAQTEAMKSFAMLDGVWRGPAMAVQPDGSRTTFVQTERIGPFLGGSIKVIEGRGYDGAGRVRFNAFGIVSYNAATSQYTLHSYAQGYVGDFPFEATGNGYRWAIPIGPATVRYTAVVEDGELHEVGDRVAPGQEPARVFEMHLKRVTDTDWPAAGAIPPQ